MILSSFDFPFNAVVVGASRGLGLGLVRALLAVPNANLVYAACRRPDHASDLQALNREHGKRLRVLALDVTREANFAIAADTITRETNRLHLVINAAGVLHDVSKAIQPERKLEDVNPQHLLASYMVNAIGPLLTAKHFLPLLAHPQRSLFANISARVGSIGDNQLGGWYGYRAAKAAQNQFTRTFAVEAKRRAPNLIVVGLHPGTVDTDLSKPFSGNVPPEQLFTVEQSVGHLMKVMDGLKTESSGQFFAWDGRSIPW